MTTDWMDRGLCRNVDPEIFFARELESECVAFCSRCPVLDPCREWAIASGGFREDGVVGGTTPDERASIRRARRRKVSA